MLTVSNYGNIKPISVEHTKPNEDHQKIKESYLELRQLPKDLLLSETRRRRLGRHLWAIYTVTRVKDT